MDDYKNESEYYLILPDQLDEPIPDIVNDYDVDEDGIRFLYRKEKVAANHVVFLTFDDDEPELLMDTDYLEMETFGLFSQKVRDVLEANLPEGVLQLVTSVITENGVEYKGFSIIHARNELFSFDEKLSVYSSIDEEDGDWTGIKKIALDKEKLSAIPLENRLVYVSKEHCMYTLYHKSVIDIIKSVNPIGMRFVPVEEWSIAVATGRE